MTGAAESSSSQASSSGSAGAVVADTTLDPVIAVGDSRNSSGDTCGFYRLEGGQTCRQPRSCYDCLNVALASASEGCVLNHVGACMGLSSYEPIHDFRANHNDTPVSYAYNNHFPSINSTYCEAADPACARCAAIASLDVRTNAQTSQLTIGNWSGSIEVAERFCVGAKGCVCLAACTPSKWVNNVAEDCSNANYNSTGAPAYATTDNYRSMLPIFMIMQLVLIFIVIHRQKLYANRVRRRAPVPAGPFNNTARAISTPSSRLELTGWRAMQEEMVQREKAQRGLVSLMSPRTTADADARGTQQLQPEDTRVSQQQQQQQSTPQHNYVIYDPHSDHDDDEEIPELPVGTPLTPVHGISVTRRRGSTDASLAMLEDGRSSDVMVRPPTTSIYEERETRSE